MYPISLNLQGKKCIVFGAGKVAQRRVWGLLDAGAEVTVAAPEKMPACWETARLTYLEQAYAPELLEEQFLVFAATDDSAENARIVRDAQAAGKLVSSATVSPDSTPDLYLPGHSAADVERDHTGRFSPDAAAPDADRAKGAGTVPGKGKGRLSGVCLFAGRW